MKRLESLDWQRGFLAISIMLYHLHYWHVSALASDTLLGRLGIYSVSMFFILSGLSIAYAYRYKIKDIKSSISFFIHRAFRIFPLLWLCIFLAIFLLHRNVSEEKLILNITLLFSFVDYGAYINTGAWSIGNEVFYYTLTPLILYLYNKGNLYGNTLLIISLILLVWFAFLKLDKNISIGEQWLFYINPFNNLFFYVMGIAIVYNSDYLKLKPRTVLIFGLLASSIFLFSPVNGNQINIVTGTNRLIFSIASILLVVFFYSYPMRIEKHVGSILKTLGMATYGIYLLHPIVSDAYNIYIKPIYPFDGEIETIAFISMVTFSIAIPSYFFIELQFIRLGKKITALYSSVATSNLIKNKRHVDQ